MPFQHQFSYIVAASALIHDFLEFFLTDTPHSILSKPLAAFPHIHCQNNVQRCERNESCAMTIINSEKKCCWSQVSNQQPPVLKSAMLLTETRRSQ